WYGVTSGGAAATVATCTGTMQVGGAVGFAYLRIEVRTSSEVHFYVDVDTTNGITETECGTGNTTNVTASALTPWINVMYNGQAAASDALDVDYFRGWQDDNVTPPTPPDDPQSQVDESNPQTTAPISPDSPDPDVEGSFFNFNAASSED